MTPRTDVARPEPRVVRWEFMNEAGGWEPLEVRNLTITEVQIGTVRAVVAVPKVCGECEKAGCTPSCSCPCSACDGTGLERCPTCIDWPGSDIASDANPPTCPDCHVTGYAHSEVTVPVRDALVGEEPIHKTVRHALAGDTESSGV